MDVSALKTAAEGMSEYIEARGEDANLDVIDAQLQLMKERLRIIRQAKQGRANLALVKG